MNRRTFLRLLSSAAIAPAFSGLPLNPSSATVSAFVPEVGQVVSATFVCREEKMAKIYRLAKLMRDDALAKRLRWPEDV